MNRLLHSPVLTKFLGSCALGLALCVAASFLARLGWFFDMFSHFAWHYAVGALLLALCFLGLRKWRWFALTVFLFTLTAGEVLTATTRVTAAAADPALTVVQFNRNVGMTDHSHLANWLRDHAQDFDIVIVQEATSGTKRMGEHLGNHYPYQAHYPADDHAFGMVILSRYEFRAIETINFNDQPFINIAGRLEIRHPGFDGPISIYPLHALPPIGTAEQAQRNHELVTVARRVAADENTRKIMMGDFNITPYSPYFRDVLKISGLQRQVTGWFTLPTWSPFGPSHGIPWLTQLPIDHILASPALRLSAEYTAQPAMSDHKALIATYTESKTAN